MTPSSDIYAFREVLSSSKNVIILAGAGLSAASGIPTYRGSGGMWNNYDVTALATPQAFEENPTRVWQFYHERRQAYINAEPNAGHRALACLSLPAVLARIAPSLDPAYSPPLLITQNVDSLSLRALESLETNVATDKSVLEMHGSIFVTRCTSCQHTQRSYAPVLSSALTDPEKHDISITDLPRCGGETWSGSNRYGRCGSLVRPDVIWFGEVPMHMGEIARRMNWCDLLLVVGTSSTVQPASGFAGGVRKRGGKVAIFNLDRSNGDQDADFIFLGPCEETLPKVLDVN